MKLGRRQTVIGRLEAVAIAGRVSLTLALLLDHLGFGFGKEIRVGELCDDLDELRVETADLLAKPLPFAREVHDFAEA